MTEVAVPRWRMTPRSVEGLLSALGPPEWLLAIVGAANLLLLLVQARTLVHAVYLNSDNASALVLPALAGHLPPGSIVNLGDHAWYELWWFMRATVGLPHHRALWEAAPFGGALLGIASVTACAWWGAGRLAGLLCAAALLAASAAMRSILFTPETRVLLVLHSGVLCGSLMFVHSRIRTGRLTRNVALAVGVPLALFTGAGLTDQLLIVGGLLPFLLAPLVLWLRLGSSPWRATSLFASAISVISLLIAALVTSIMNGDHVIHAPFPIEFVQSSMLVTNLQNLIAGFASLGGGSFFGAPVSGNNLTVFALGALTLIAVIAVLRSIWLWGTATERPAAPLAVPDRASERRELLIAYWAFALLLIVAAFLLTTVIGSGADGRYLLGAWIAVAALLGAFATASRVRSAITIAVCVFGALTLRANLVYGVASYGPGPDQQTAGAIERFVTANGASTGYGGYWDSAPVAWETHLLIKVYPIWPCQYGPGLCAFSNNQISSWYTPRGGISTFLLTNSHPGEPLAVPGPIASFGQPFATATFGTLTVYIYHHDIAANLGVSA